MEPEKKERLTLTVRSSGDEQREGGTRGTSDQLAPEEEFQQLVEATDNGLFDALDYVSQDSDDYWEQISEEKIRSYRDTHPSIVTDKERTISVYVDGTGKYKGKSALERVEIKDSGGSRICDKRGHAREKFSTTPPDA